jgi:hypothetical protein
MATAKKTPPVKRATRPAAKAAPRQAAAKPAAKAPVAQAMKQAAKAPAKVAKPKAAPADTPKTPKHKLVRDSFTMPQADFNLIAQLKGRALAFMRPAKKSELLRAGLHALTALDDARLRAALDALAPLKPGRPKKTA